LLFRNDADWRVIAATASLERQVLAKAAILHV